MDNITCAPVTPVSPGDLALDIATNAGVFAVALPQLYKLARSSSSEGVSLSTCVLTVALLWLQLSAALVTKWLQIRACAEVGLARCIPDLLDATQLLLVDLANMAILVCVVRLKPTNGPGPRALAFGVIGITWCSWGACVALSAAQPCGDAAQLIARACAYGGALLACVQVCPGLCSALAAPAIRASADAALPL
jgi:hypothetical protein